ncbi:MAG: hypothetical protein SGPRY_008664 [Prymnesium sp.]
MSTAPASVRETIAAINAALTGSDFSCAPVSWDDVQRGTVGGSLSCYGANITDTRLYEKNGTQLFTVRSHNWNEQLGCVSASQLALVASDGSGSLSPLTLETFLQQIGAPHLGGYAGLDSSTDLHIPDLDDKVSIRFQTTFLPVADAAHGAVEFAPEMYNYQTRDDSDPQNLLLLCTTQGVAVQQDGKGAKKVFHHALDPEGSICRYWFEAERSKHRVGGAQKETKDEATAAAARGKATAAVIGTRAMGTRFNVLMTIQVPLQQKARQPSRSSTLFMSSACSEQMCSGSESEYDEESGDEMLDGCLFDYEEDDFACVTRYDGGPLGWVGRQVAQAASKAARYRDRYMYNTVAGGVPEVADVRAAIADMEQLYAACNWNGKLADAGAAFMKSELTASDSAKISAKLTEQPYVPPSVGMVVGGDLFPEK